MGSSDTDRSQPSGVVPPAPLLGGASNVAGSAASAPRGASPDSPFDFPLDLPLSGPRAGWVADAGFEFVRASAEEVVMEWTVSERHLQPHGIVHGGVYTTVVETSCSIGAMLAAPPGKVVVGVENHTSFVRPVRKGRLTARATPLHAGRRAQLWECSIVDAERRLVASGRLRVFAVDAEAETGRER
jgi:uncharacterized protein (TIGR00369 family)